MDDKAFHFDFAFPAGAFGFSSGWRHKLAQTEAVARFNHCELYFRRPVCVKRIGDGRWLPAAESQMKFGVLMKHASDREGDFPALSSGAGSALIAREGGVFRYKRCGSRDKGVLGTFGEVFYRSVDADVMEYEDPEPIGLLALNRARRELDLVAELHDRGLCPHCRPFGLVEFESPSPHHVGSCGAAVMEISSDVRIDEFALICLTPLLVYLLSEGYYRFRPVDFSFDPNSVPAGLIIEKWEFIFRRIEKLGNLVGRSYRAFYDAGYYRGRGNAWLGNDIIGADARISIVDLDEVIDSRAHSLSRQRLFQAIEINEYIGRISALFSGQCSFPIIFGAAGMFLTDGFREGYSEQGECITPEEIAKIVFEFEHSLLALRAQIEAQSPQGYLVNLGALRGFHKLPPVEVR